MKTTLVNLCDPLPIKVSSSKQLPALLHLLDHSQQEVPILSKIRTNKSSLNVILLMFLHFRESFRSTVPYF